MIYHDMGPGGFFPIGLFGGLACLLFFAGLVLLIIWMIRGSGAAGMYRAPSSPPAPPAPPHDSPLDILSRRFAAGDITAEEFQKARDLLKQSSGQ